MPRRDVRWTARWVYRTVFVFSAAVALLSLIAASTLGVRPFICAVGAWAGGTWLVFTLLAASQDPNLDPPSNLDTGGPGEHAGPTT